MYVCTYAWMDVWYGMRWAGQGRDGMRVGWDVDMYGMDVCMYVHTYVCMYVSMYVCMYVCM